MISYGLFRTASGFCCVALSKKRKQFFIEKIFSCSEETFASYRFEGPNCDTISDNALFFQSIQLTGHDEATSLKMLPFIMEEHLPFPAEEGVFALVPSRKKGEIYPLFCAHRSEIEGKCTYRTATFWALERYLKEYVGVFEGAYIFMNSHRLYLLRMESGVISFATVFTLPFVEQDREKIRLQTRAIIDRYFPNSDVTVNEELYEYLKEYPNCICISTQFHSDVAISIGLAIEARDPQLQFGRRVLQKIVYTKELGKFLEKASRVIFFMSALSLCVVWLWKEKMIGDLPILSSEKGYIVKEELLQKVPIPAQMMMEKIITETAWKEEFEVEEFSIQYGDPLSEVRAFIQMKIVIQNSVDATKFYDSLRSAPFIDAAKEIRFIREKDEYSIAFSTRPSMG